MGNKVQNSFTKGEHKLSHWFKTRGKQAVRKTWRGMHHGASILSHYGVPFAGSVNSAMNAAEISKDLIGGIRHYRRLRRAGKKPSAVKMLYGHLRRNLGSKDFIRHTDNILNYQGSRKRKKGHLPSLRDFGNKIVYPKHKKKRENPTGYRVEGNKGTKEFPPPKRRSNAPNPYGILN
jgi:hypothetical protein